MTMDGQQELYPASAEAYTAFVDKFKPKLTTDDCYTPAPVYDAVASWVAEEYGLDRTAFVRPFRPGGDYQTKKYTDGAVVVDNPPFSILAEIVRWFSRHGVRFFLFAPALTLFTAPEVPGVCYLPTDCPVVYANGATVKTSFLTNLDTARIRCVPELYRRVADGIAAAEQTRKNAAAELPKYDYPPEVITAAAINKYARYGAELTILADEAVHVRALDAQRAAGKALFGGGFLIKPRAAAERAAAERAAATVWELSDRERALIGLPPKEKAQESLFK